MKTLLRTPSIRLLSHAALAAAIFAAGTAFAADSTTTPEPKASTKASAAAGETMTAASFIKEAAQANAAEIALAEVAERKAQSQDVKQFAQHIRQDHTAANQKLQPIAAKHGVQINQSLDAKHQKKLDDLQKASGAEFDKEFVQCMLKDHAKAISKFEKASQQIQDADVKQYAQSTLPKLHQHMAHAKQAAASVGIDQSTITSLTSEQSDAMGGADDDAKKESGKAGSKPESKP